MRAEILDDPFVAGPFLGDGLLHQLCLGVDFSAARNPIEPDEVLRLCVGGGAVARLFTRAADFVAVLAAGLAGTWDAEVFALTTPANDIDFLLLAHEMTDFSARAGAAAVRAAAVGTLGASGGCN